MIRREKNSDAFKKLSLSDSDIEILNSMIIEKVYFRKFKNLVKKYNMLGFSLLYLKENWEEITTFNSHDSSSLKYFQTMFGDKNGSELFLKKCKDCTTTREDYITRYGDNVDSILRQQHGASLDIYITRYGNVDGIVKWNEYCSKRKKSYEEGKKNKKYKGRNLEWFINKYGEDDGYKIWNEKKETSPRC
jgi:hypothetical protein